MTTSRRLAAILAADVAGYARLMAPGRNRTIPRRPRADLTFHTCITARSGSK